MKITLLGLISFLMTLSPAAYAREYDPYSLNTVLQDCKKLSLPENVQVRDHLYKVGKCTGLIKGFMDGAALAFLSSSGSTSTAKLFFCVPDTSNIRQWIAIFVKYGEEHPEQWHNYWTGAYIGSLGEAFPCDE